MKGFPTDTDILIYCASTLADMARRGVNDIPRKLDLMPAGYTGSPNASQLASFFTMSDIHITDEESPAQVPYFGFVAPFGTGGLYSSSYSPVMLSTTQVLDAAVRTVNALHAEAPLNFGVILGDMANSSQYNELRWFVDVLDGKPIDPSSGAHAGADTIDYQKPFQAAGLNPAIPWYAVAGNHDQYWMGVNFPSEKLQAAFVGNTVLDMGANLFADDATEQTGTYSGVVDSTTPLGGPAANFATPPTVVADADRHSMTTVDSTLTGMMAELANSTSLPAGHGMASSNPPACYVFRPVADLPLKVIVLDDTCKTTANSPGPAFYGSGWMDAERFAWLTAELQAGQDDGELMVIATHIPMNPQADLDNTTKAPQFYPGSFKSDEEMIATLHGYPNLLMVMAGHRHLNTVTPQPSPDPAHPENGFWQVETPSLRDFPQQFRTFQIHRNVDNSISIVTTDVDPIVEDGSPAAKSRGYGIGEHRIAGHGSLSDTGSHTYNAELVKLLTPAMQAKIATYGTARAVVAE